jgi:hypothetical protein
MSAVMESMHECSRTAYMSDRLSSGMRWYVMSWLSKSVSSARLWMDDGSTSGASAAAGMFAEEMFRASLSMMMVRSLMASSRMS